MLLKEFKLQIIGHKSYDEAVVTAGGIRLNEVNPQTMESKIVKNLYFAGEVIDIDEKTHIIFLEKKQASHEDYEYDAVNIGCAVRTYLVEKNMVNYNGEKT